MSYNDAEREETDQWKLNKLADCMPNRVPAFISMEAISKGKFNESGAWK